jgi:hypothetical protein
MITIKEVITKKDLKRFVCFPFTLYRTNPYWVPPLIADEMKTLSRKHNPSFDFCEAVYFLAYKNGELAGRIAGVINHKANEKWKNKLTRFDWVDFTDDEEVSHALLNAVETWGKSKGMTGIHGPMGFTDFDSEGMLVDGFDKLPSIVAKYNYPYYPAHMEKHGYVKSVDWLQHKFPASQPVPEKVERINKLISQKYKLTTKEFTRRKEVLLYSEKMFDTINQSFADLYGYTELSPKQIAYYIKAYFPFLRPELACFILDENDDIAGFGLSMPTLSRAFQKAKGKLLPFGWFHILRALNKYDTIDLYFNGVHPSWQNRGVHSLYYVAMNNAYISRGVKIAIATPQLENNINAVGIWDNYEKEFYMRTRCYIKEKI